MQFFKELFFFGGGGGGGASTSPTVTSWQNFLSWPIDMYALSRFRMPITFNSHLTTNIPQVVNNCWYFVHYFSFSRSEATKFSGAQTSRAKPGSTATACFIQHPWTQRCSVFKRALSLSTQPRGTHGSSPCSCTVDPIKMTAWVGAVIRESATDLVPHSFHVSLCAVSHCSDSSSKIPCWKLHETGCGLLYVVLQLHLRSRQ